MRPPTLAVPSESSITWKGSVPLTVELHKSIFSSQRPSLRWMTNHTEVLSTCAERILSLGRNVQRPHALCSFLSSLHRYLYQ
jgi:hypothetical protein